MKRILIAGLLLGLASGGFAMRCGNQIVTEGDSEYKVRQLCNIKEEYIVNNEQADVKSLYSKEAGMTNEYVIIDGKLHEINSHR